LWVLVGLAVLLPPAVAAVVAVAVGVQLLHMCLFLTSPPEIKQLQQALALTHLARGGQQHLAHLLPPQAQRRELLAVLALRLLSTGLVQQVGLGLVALLTLMGQLVRLVLRLRVETTLLEVLVGLLLLVAVVEAV
jgi:hypothetical protein